jgi:hypothetical protein
MRNEIKTWNGLELATNMSEFSISKFSKTGKVGDSVLIHGANSSVTEAVIDSETENYYRVAGRLFSKRDGTERGGYGKIYLSHETLKNYFLYLEHRRKIERVASDIRRIENEILYIKREIASREQVKESSIVKVENISSTQKLVSFQIGSRSICEVYQSKGFDESAEWNEAEVSMTGTRYTGEYATLAPLAIAEAFKLCAEWNAPLEQRQAEARSEGITNREAQLVRLGERLESLKAIQ